MRRFAWPTDSRPVVEFFGGWRNAIRDHVMLVDHRDRPWNQAKTWEERCELTAQFCEGKLHATPGHWGPREPETREIAAELAHANRKGFLTENSQPSGAATVTGWDGHAEVLGIAHEHTVGQLARLVRDTRLELTVTEPRGWESGDPLEVTIRDPDPNGGRLLWERLGQPDWDNPTPPTETDMPDSCPPGCSVLDHNHGTGYRLYAGEPPDTNSSTRPVGTPMSEPDVKVHHSQGCELDGRTDAHTHTQHDWRALIDSKASAQPSTPATPATPAEAPMNQAAAGAIHGVSQVTPTGLATSAASAATGEDIKSPMAAATNSSSSTGGAGVSNIEEAKAGIAKSKEELEAAQQAAQQVAEKAEAARQALEQAAEGSDQGEYEAAKAELQRIIEVAEELVKLCQTAPETLEGIRL